MSIETERQLRTRQEERKWIPLSGLERALEKTPSPLRTSIIMDLQIDIETGLIVTTEDQAIADTLLKEVTERVFGFSLRDLSPDELREIIKIRRDLNITVKFDPTS